MASSTGKSRARTRGPAGCSRTLRTRPDGGHEGKSSEHKRLGTVSFARVRITPPEGGTGDAPQRDSPTGGATWLPSSGPLANREMGEPGPASSCRQRIASGHLMCWRRRCAPIVTLIRSLGRTKRARRRGGRRGSQRRKTFRASPNEGTGSMTAAGSKTPSRAVSSERKVRRILG